MKQTQTRWSVLSSIFSNKLVYQDNCKLAEPQIKPKPTNKTKTSEQKATKATIFLCTKTSKRGEIAFFCVFLKN